MKNRMYPFNYNFQEESGFKSYFDQRKPTRTKVCETVYKPTEVNTFMSQNEAPSPNIANITGYTALDEAEDNTETVDEVPEVKPEEKEDVADDPEKEDDQI